MLEREMEDLIATYPEEFFPRSDFRLSGRQRSFQGIGRFDLLFTDHYGMNILMELKAVPAGYATVDQVARYRDALVERGHANVIMWIVAPAIPAGMREMLGHVGVEYSEIHFSEFRRVANLKGYPLRADNVVAPLPPPKVEAPRTEAQALAVASEQRVRPLPEQSDIDAWGFGIGTQPAFLLRTLEAGDRTKEQMRSEFIAHFYPYLPYSEAKGKSGFGVFFSDSRRPIGSYHASRSLLILADPQGRLSIDTERSKLVKSAVQDGILDKLRGLDFKRDKARFNEIVESYGLPTER